MGTVINLNKIPPGALQIIRVLEAAGHEAWLVGGCVRDLLMDRTPADWDITTDALPEAVQGCFSKVIPTGIAHGTLTVLQDQTPFEVTTFRSESTYSDHRRPDAVTFVRNLREDLARRDFTINALAWHPHRGLADPFGGLGDIESRCIRAVGNPEERFGEDALRMLRGVRFAAQLDFDVDPRTLEAIRNKASSIVHISGERIRVELDKWLMSEATGRWGLLRDSGLLGAVLPELERCWEIPQNTPWHRESVGVHMLRAAAAAPKNRWVRWALLLHDLGKADTRTTDEAGIDHFYGHEARSEALAQDILTRLRWDNTTRLGILNLIRHHDREVLPGERSVRRAMVAIGQGAFTDWLAVRRGDLLAQNPVMTAPALAMLAEVQGLAERILEQDQCLSLRDLAITGRDLMALGIPPGPEIGRVLRCLLEGVLEEPERNTRELLIHQVKDMEH